MMPGVETTSHIDERGNPIKTTVQVGGIPFVITLADKALALAKVNPPELMASTLVTPDRTIAKPRSVRRAEYLLSVREGEIPDVVSTGWQKAERLSQREMRVIVDTQQNTSDDAADLKNPIYLGASGAINIDDSMLKSLAEKALDSPRATDAQVAEALRAFVFRYIDKKSLGVGFATASEVARTKQGDCSEHATLLAALLRTQGIPSRVVSGVVYVDAFLGADNIFGYHMWTQALLDVNGRRQWVDLDPSFPKDQSFDATHIALTVSALNDGEVLNSMVPLASLLGRLDIKVVKTE
jgi:transglutaminase-like putative cysteine protease